MSFGRTGHRVFSTIRSAEFSFLLASNYDFEPLQLGFCQTYSSKKRNNNAPTVDFLGPWQAIYGDFRKSFRLNSLLYWIDYFYMRTRSRNVTTLFKVDVCP